MLPRISGLCRNQVYWSWSLWCILFQIHINIITYLRWLLDLRCEWYDETFKWTSGTHGHLIFFTSCQNIRKSLLLLRIPELASCMSCWQWKRCRYCWQGKCCRYCWQWKCCRDQVGLNLPKVNFKRNQTTHNARIWRRIKSDVCWIGLQLRPHN